MKRKICKTLSCIVIVSLLFVTAPLVCCAEEYPQPDLTISAVVHRAGLMQNWHLANVWVWNIGDWPADSGFTTRILLNEVGGRSKILVDFVHPIGIPVGLFYLIAHPFYLSNDPPRQYYLSAYTDYFNDIDESNENNNGWVNSDTFWA